VRRALEIPLGGLEDEVKNLYYKKGLLQKVLKDAESLIDKSRQEAQPDTDDYDLAVPRLTGGGIITLERTLAKLRTLLQDYTSKA
jgi:ubiquitin-conjugating enzyme E2 O